MQKALAYLDSVQVDAVYGPETISFLPETVHFLVEMGTAVIHLNPDTHRLGNLHTGLDRIRQCTLLEKKGNHNTMCLLDRSQFVEYVADMAHELGKRRAEEIGDYIEVMDAVGRLAPVK